MSTLFPSRWCRRALTLGLGLLAITPAALADPIDVAPGPVVLPMTGLALTLPADPRKGAKWSLTGSWSLTEGGSAFDARDVVDLKVDGKMVAGNWVHVGYFNAGDCGAVVKTLDVPDRWTAERDQWGLHWHVAGGTWDFANDLGKVPVVALCAPRPNRASLLLYHFFVQTEAPLGRDAQLAAIAKDALLMAVAEAWSKERFGAVQPTKRVEVKRRGDLLAARKVRLERAAMDLALPDDGYVWLVRPPGKDDSSDYLDRMAPAMPDVSVELARAPGMRCDGIFPTTGPDAPQRAKEPPPKGVPTGWTSLGAMVIPSGLERVICRDSKGTATIVGLIVTPAKADIGQNFRTLVPLLDAIAAGGDAAPLKAAPPAAK